MANSADACIPVSQDGARPQAVGSWIDRIRINSIHSEVRGPRTVWVKTRRRGSAAVIAAANAFFRFANARVSVFNHLELWQAWEVNSFSMLHQNEFAAFAEGRRTVCADQLPGTSLCHLLDAGELDEELMAAAGSELQRAHGMHSTFYAGPWSHGDPHLGNFIFDFKARRCRLIDFEVHHGRNLMAQERHADDLLIPLLDLAGRIERDRLISLTLSYLTAYGSPEVVARMRDGLRVPSGLGRLWWWIRTSYLNSNELASRVQLLRNAVEAMQRSR